MRPIRVDPSPSVIRQRRMQTPPVSRLREELVPEGLQPHADPPLYVLQTRDAAHRDMEGQNVHSLDLQGNGPEV